MSVPRISGFARLANGNVTPNRIIEGQNTNLSRTMHGLAYDDLHDEIIVPVALSGAVLVFVGLLLVTNRFTALNSRFAFLNDWIGSLERALQ